jgi:hypothetical protein
MRWLDGTVRSVGAASGQLGLTHYDLSGYSLGAGVTLRILVRNRAAKPCGGPCWRDADAEAILERGSRSRRASGL